MAAPSYEGHESLSASIIQGSAVGPVSHVVTASDLHPVAQSNFILKYADDTYLIISAKIIHSCSSELSNIDKSCQVVRDNLCQAENPEINVQATLSDFRFHAG